MTCCKAGLLGNLAVISRPPASPGQLNDLMMSHSIVFWSLDPRSSVQTNILLCRVGSEVCQGVLTRPMGDTGFGWECSCGLHEVCPCVLDFFYTTWQVDSKSKAFSRQCRSCQTLTEQIQTPAQRAKQGRSYAGTPFFAACDPISLSCLTPLLRMLWATPDPHLHPAVHWPHPKHWNTFEAPDTNQ